MKSCFFQNTQETFSNNEEFKIYLHKKNRSMLFLSIAGLLLGFIGFFVELFAESLPIAIAIDDYMLGVYAGAGIGMFCGGISKILQHRQWVKDEKKLTKMRRERSDERLQQISVKANQAATYIMLIALYLLSFIGGLFYPILPKILLLLICLFLVSYVAAYRILEKRM